MTEEKAAEREGSSPLTTRSRATKFTPERIQQIKNLVERGKSRDEIADILGVPVGSLQVTCSHLGVSLRRPKTIDGVFLLKKREPPRANATVPQNTGDQDARVPLQPTQEPQEERATTPDACSASFAIRFQYRGMERTDELPLTLHTVGQLALVAALRDVKISELIAELITAMMNKDLFPSVLDNVDNI